MRNRIASVKATQKITKAMQMVAAAKLRRAQMAAEAARPYAERMDGVLANLAGAIADPRQAPPLLGGTGRDETHLLVVCTGERGLCGAFNSSIARLARERANALLAEGKTVKIICVGRKGYDILKRNFERQIIEVVDFRSVRQLGFGKADLVGQKIRELYDEGDFDVCTLFYSTFRSVIAQIPTAKRLIPAEVPRLPSRRERSASPMTTSPTRARSSPSSCRATSRCRCCGRCWRTTPPSTARR